MELIVVVTNVISCLIKACALLGMLIVLFLKGIILITIHIVRNIGYFIDDLLEGFPVFAADVLSYATDLKNGILWCCSTTSGILEALFFGLINILTKHLEAFVFCADEVFYIVSILGDSICLLGLCIWMIPKGFLLVLKFICYFFIEIVMALTQELCDAVQSDEFIVLNMPFEAVAGLSLGGLFIYGNWKLDKGKHMLKFCKVLFHNCLQISTKALIRIAYALEIAVWVFKTVPANLVYTRAPLQKKTEIVKTIKKIHKNYIESPSKVELLHQVEKLREENLCVICYNQRRDTILLNCRHLCLCQSCTLEILQSSGECPLCRHRISRFLNVYV